MIFVQSIIIAVIVALLLPLVSSLTSRIRRIGKKGSGEPEAREVLLNLISRLQCEADFLGDDRNDPFGTVAFTFQGGHFIATFPDNDDPFTNTISISFFSCFSCELAQAKILEQVVNEINSMALPVKCTMAPQDEEEHDSLVVSLHSSGIRLFNDDRSLDLLKTLLSCFFHIQRSVAERFDAIKEIEPGDIYQNRHPFAKSVHAIALAEMNGQPEGWKGPWYEIPDWTVEELVTRITGHGIPYDYELQIGTETFVGDEKSTILPLKELIRHFEENDDDNSNRSFLVINIWPKVIDADIPTPINIVLTLEAFDEKLYRFRINYVEPSMEITPYRPLDSPESLPEARSLVLCVHRGGPEDIKAEAEYMAGEEGLVEKCLNGDAAYSLYWGRVLFADSRYLEAEHYLRNAFALMCKPMQDPESQSAETCHTFYDLCFFLGTVYYHLGRYRESYYYLDIIVQQHRLRWTQQYILTLQALGDPRVPSILKSLLEMTENAEGDDAVDELREFIRRQFIIVDIRNGNTEKARKALEKMLDEDPDSTFALHWLSKLI